MLMGRAGVRKAEQITEFGEKKLAVGAFGGAGGGPAGDERSGGGVGHGQQKCCRMEGGNEGKRSGRRDSGTQIITGGSGDR